VFILESINVLATIKKDIEKHVGERVTLKANGGRRKVLVNNEDSSNCIYIKKRY